MANIESQKKRIRQNEVRRVRNKAVKSDLKTAIKKAQNAEGDDAAEAFRAAQQKIDQAATKGVLHPKAAARRKSRLSKSVSAS